MFDSLRIARHLSAIRHRQAWHIDSIDRFRKNALLDTLRYAVANTAYYRSLGIDPTELRSVGDLRRFPVLTKTVVQERHRELIADNYSLDACKTSTTSGSTGEPTTTAFDDDSWLLCKYAQKIHRLLAYGIGIGKRVLIVSEMHADEIAAKSSVFGAGVLFGQDHVSIHEPVTTAVDRMRQYRPHAVYAFPSFLAELFETCEQRGVSLPPSRVVFTSSEVLGSKLRARIKSMFNADVCDVYGCTEFKEVAWQCPEGSYHINFDSAWVETVDIGDDGFGMVLLTTLVNRAMPLIRYRVGDRGKLGAGECSCGRAGPWLEAVSGREVDLLVLADGRRLSPYLLTSIVELDPAMRRYQLVQDHPRSLEVRYIGEAGAVVDERVLSRSLAATIGTQMDITFERVSSLPRTPGGKQKVFLRQFDAVTGS